MTDSTLQRGLDSSTKAEIPTPDGKLCDKCQAIPWNPDDFKHLKRKYGATRWDFSHHDTFGELETSCEAGCPLCQTFFLLLVYCTTELKGSDLLHWKLDHDDGSWSLHCKANSLPDGQGVWSMRNKDWCPPSQSITNVKRLTSENFANDFHLLVGGNIIPWIDTCTRSGKHKGCPSAPPHQSDSYRMPTRLIDVGTVNETTVRLVNTTDLSEAAQRSPYVILSYCWGPGNNASKTTRRNLEERLQKLDHQRLSQTIKDAIRLTQLMKIRYLWVDAVCIIQTDNALGGQHHDDVARADWEKESTQMGAYYSNSVCCIAASNAKDSSEGFLTERRVARYRYTKWLAPPNVFLPSPYSLRDQSKSVLFDRGWCLQEWILSPRILHWTVNGLIWQCSHGFFWEGQNGFQGEAPELFGDVPGDDEARQTNDCLLEFGIESGGPISQIIYSEQEEVLGEIWAELVSEYSQMKLTVPSDRLAAIQGIASCLSERYGVEYFAGLFRSKCAYHLMWVTEDPQNTLGVNEDFPTWSWASSKRKICFGDINEDESTSFLEDLEAFPSAQDGESLTRIAKKELCFTAPLIRFSLLGPEEREPENTRSDDSDYGDDDREISRFSLVSEIPFWKGLVCNIHVDDLATSPSLKNKVHLLVLWSLPYDEGTEYRGLVVQAVEEHAGGVEVHDCGSSYRRIGIFSIDKPGDRNQESQGLKGWRKKIVLV